MSNEQCNFDRQSNSISYIRFISMIMIILCHFFQFYGNELAWWFNVGVELFFFISGFLYGNKEISDPIAFLKARFKKILIPYYIFLIPLIFVSLIFNSNQINASLIIKSLFCAGTIKGTEHLWFVGYILFCYLITPYLYLIKKRLDNLNLVQSLCVLIVFLISIIIVTKLIDFYFLPIRFLSYIVGYFIAALYKRYGKSFLYNISIFFTNIALITNSIRIYLKYFSSLLNNALIEKIFNLCEPYAHMCLGISLFLILYFVFGKSNLNFIIMFSDKYSYYIYLVHHVFILGPFSLMKITNIEPINYLIIIFTIFISSWLLYYVHTKLLNISNKKICS